MEHKLIFFIESDDKNQCWHGNIDKAFKEFFEAKDREFSKQEKRMIGIEENWEDADYVQTELGKGRENSFEASSGLKIYWENLFIKNLKNNPELIRKIVNRIKKLSKTRKPKYDLPADSFINNCAKDIVELIAKCL